MNGITVLLALATVGVDYGWQPGTDGQLEYIIQIQPAALESLRSGRDITSEIHPDARGVRRFRIHVGTDPLPRIGVMSPNTSPTRLSTSDNANNPAYSAPPVTGFPAGGGASPATISDEPPYTTPLATGILNLPPPPALIGPDGKASVLVRPGDRALPGVAAPAGTGLPTYDSTPPGTTGAGSLTVPSPPPSGAGGWQVPESPVTVPSGAPGSFGPPNPGIFPVPGAGPETGFPEPVRGAGWNRGGSSTVESTAANEQDKQPTTSDLLSQLAANRGEAAAQKPTLDKETAERLKEEMRAEQPWAPLVLTSLALFGSLAANAYLGWIAAGVYRRYREMCDELHEAQASLT